MGEYENNHPVDAQVPNEPLVSQNKSNWKIWLFVIGLILILIVGFLIVSLSKTEGEIGVEEEQENAVLPQGELIFLSSPQEEYLPGEIILFDALVKGDEVMTLVLTDGGIFQEDMLIIIPEVLDDNVFHYQFEFPTHESASGVRKFWLVAMIDDEVYSSNEIEILVRPSGDIEEIWFSVNPTWDTVFLFPGMTEQLYVHGLYSDGVVRRIGKELGTEFFESEYGSVCDEPDASGSLDYCDIPSETDVFDISEDGLITAKNPGMASVLVKNGDVWGSIEVQVELMDLL
jgi:hypothetical protein